MNSEQHESSSAADIEAMHAVVVGTADREIVTLEARLRAAQLASDVAVLDALIADDLLFAGPDGALATKAQDLGAHASGVVRFREHTPLALRTQHVGSHVVIASLLASLAVEVAGSLVTGLFRYTRVWAKEADAPWRIVGGHVSAVQAPPDNNHARSE